MAQLLSSKVTIVEEEPSVRTVQGVPTAITAFVGIAERGPIATPTFVTSFEEYERNFGGFTADSDLALAVAGFFTNGGTQAWIVRTVHFTDITDPASATSAAGTLSLSTAVAAPSAGEITSSNAAPFDLTAGDTLVIDVDAGGTATATFDAAAAAITSGNTETFDLADGLTLTVDVNNTGVQTVTFDTAEFSDITNATALEVAAVMNAELTGCSVSVSTGAVVITSDIEGTDSEVEVTGGTANTGGANRLGFSTTPVTGTGDVADINGVTVAEIKTVVEADVAGLTVNDVSGTVQIVSNTTGASSSIQVDATSTADDEIGFDNAVHSGSSGAAAPTLTVNGKTDGAYSDVITVTIAAATSGSSDEFNLTVLDDGLVAEVFPNLSMVDANDNFVETVINDADNGSRLIAVVDLDSTSSDPRPAVGTFGPLSGGDDGLTSLDDNDFIGSSAGPTGMRAFDQVQDLALLVIPGRATSAVHNAMISYCEVTRALAMFPVLDPPADQSATEIVTYVETTAQLLNLSEFGAIYWPRVAILNPNKTIFGDTDEIIVPPSGHIAGAYARTDGNRPGGVYRAPAGIETGRLFGVLGFETDETLDEAKRDLVYPKRINPITTIPGSPIHIDGSRTLKGGGNFPSVPERRGVIFIEQSLRQGLAFLKHQPNTEATRAIANRTVTLFLLNQMQIGAFSSTDPQTAFFVDTSEALNPPSVVFAGQMVIRIGLATAKPAEFIILRVAQDTRALDEELAAAG